MRTGFITGHDGTPVFLRTWLPERDPVGILQVAHGMIEHSGRYAALAQRLITTGWAVYAHDHRGHGRTAPTVDDLGHFGDSEGWAKTVADLRLISHQAQSAHPGRPLVLFGHSMGSFLARAYATEHSDQLAGLILSGTAGDPGVLGRIGRLVAVAEARLHGGRSRSRMMNALVFGLYNRAFQPTRTDFDWLSRDETQVDAYLADPLCGYAPTAGFFRDMLGGLIRLCEPDAIRHLRLDMPVYLFSGELDPVGAAGRGVRRLAAQLRSAGMRDITLKLYPQGRHEMLNEINSTEVMEDVISWLNSHVQSH